MPNTLTPPALKFNVVYDDGEPSSVVLYHDGNEYVANTTHRNFSRIIALLDEANPNGRELIELFDIAEGITTKFARLSDRMTITNGKMLFDGEEEHGFMVDMILGFYDQGVDDWKPIVAFREKIAQNPNPHSREQLFRWLTVNKFSIDAEGNIIAYKGVNRRTGLHTDDLKYQSSSRGRALVNGVWYEGAIPTSPGTIVEMPRSEVQHDPSIGCHKGLHAGDWSYASNFAEVTLRVQINPRDVVSVPTDCADRKMRVCRYRVLDVVTDGNVDPKLIQLDEGELRTRALAPVEKSTVIVPKAELKAKSVRKAAKAAVNKIVGKKREAVSKKAPKAAAPTKAAAKKVAEKVAEKKAVKAVAPRFYEDFKKADFAVRPFNELRWLAKEWGVKAGSNPNRDTLVVALTKAAASRNRKLSKGTLDSKPVRVKP